MAEDKNVPANAHSNLPDAAGRMQDLLAGMANINESIAEAGGIASSLPFIGINNDGVWAYGQERTSVEEGSHWAIDVRSLQHGYIAWPDQKSKDRKPLGERMVPANMPKPLQSSLPDVGQPYQLQFAFQMTCVSGEDQGVLAIYKNGSYGAKVLVQSLLDEVRKQARVNQDALCPVVVLDMRSYFHQEWKRNINNPVFQIQKWISFEEYDAFIGEPAAAEPQPEPEVKAATRGPAPAAPKPAARRPSTRTQPSA